MLIGLIASAAAAIVLLEQPLHASVAIGPQRAEIDRGRGGRRAAFKTAVSGAAGSDAIQTIESSLPPAACLSHRWLRRIPNTRSRPLLPLFRKVLNMSPLCSISYCAYQLVLFMRGSL